MRRRRFLALAAALSSSPAWTAPASSAPRAQAEDFDALWQAIDGGYAYFGNERRAWKRARDLWRPKAAAAKTRAELVLALEGAIAHLHDDHVTLSERAPLSARRIPAETDLWAQWKDGAATISAVRAFGEADVAGLHPGHVVTHVNGIAVEQLVRARLRAIGASGPAAMDWALRHLLAGPRAGRLAVAAKDAKGATVFSIERAPASAANGPPIIARRMGEDRDVGYLRIRNGLADPRLPVQFGAALGYLRDTRALILDLRETPDGGTRAGVEAILAHFVSAPSPWQAREMPGRARIVDTVAPNADPPYGAPVVALVDRWTAGEGEALAAGLDALGRTTLMGTAMAGLRGERREMALPNSGIAVRFPAEKTYHVNGTPREALRPAVEIDLAAPSGGPGDPILYQALKRTETLSPARAGRTAPR